MVTHMSDEDRRSLAELYAEDDRLRAEHEQWMADREAAAHAPVRKSDESAVLYREHHDNAPAPAPQPDAEPSDGDDELAHAIDVFAQAVENRLAELDSELVKRDRKIGELEGELREIKGMLGATLTLLGQQKPKLWKP
jgi:cell division septum initiation protein DivIVA